MKCKNILLPSVRLFTKITTNKLFVFFILFLYLGDIEIKAQNDSYASPFLNTQYQFSTGYYDSVVITKCDGCVLPCREFKGLLAPSIAYLWKKDSVFVRVKGEVPFSRIYYYIRSVSCTDMDDIVEMLKRKLQNDFHFSTEIILDTAEVLSLEIVDPIKLARYECSYYGAGGHSTYNKEMDFLDVHNMGLSVLTNIFKEKLSRKIYLQANEEIGYCFRVSGQIINSTSINVINKYLTENLGLELKKEKRLEEFLIIDFTK